MANNNRNQYNQDWDRNRRRFDQENDYNQNYDYDQNRNMRNDYGNSGMYSGSSYGNQNGGQNNWNDDPNYNRGTGSYGNNYGANMGTSGRWNNDRENKERRWRNTGSNYDSSYSHGAYENWDRRRNYENTNRANRDWWDRTRDEVSSWFGDDDAERRRDADKRTMGVHKGKGPKGYTRSDDRIREDVHDRLADDSYVDASDIEVKVENGNVILTGNVSDRDQKRRAEDIIEAVSGVRDVENRLHVHHEHNQYADAGQRRGDYKNYTGTTDDLGGIGRESGTTNEVIRDTGNMNSNK